MLCNVFLKVLERYTRIVTLPALYNCNNEGIMHVFMRLFWAKNILALLVFCFLYPLPMLHARTSVICEGSSNLRPVIQKIAEEYMITYPDKNIFIVGGSSSRGIKSLIDGTADIALSSAAIPPEYFELAAAKGIKLFPKAFVLDALVPVVHPSNPITTLNKRQLKDIFSGKIVSWKEVGGDDVPIHVYSHGGESGGYLSWRELVMGTNTVVRPDATFKHSRLVRQELSKDSRGISYMPYGNYGKNKAIAVDGIEASRDNVLQKKFPLVRTMEVVTALREKPALSKGQLQNAAAIEHFLAYMFDKNKGGRIREEMGLLAPKAE